nr:outer membrane lipoprotein chaperone LolA [uncultured Halomonas sp.]
MKVSNKLATMGMALMMPLAASADEQAASRLTSLLEPLETYSAGFEQQILDSSGSQLQSAEGTMLLSRPGKFRWEVDAPYKQVVVSDGEEIYLYDPDLAQVTVQPLDTRVTHTPALLLSGSADALADDYEVSRQQQGATETFSLIPKSPDTLFEQLKLVFHSETLRGLRMNDSTGQQTAISFQNPQYNQTIDPSTFEFEIPEDVDVIRESR